MVRNQNAHASNKAYGKIRVEAFQVARWGLRDDDGPRAKDKQNSDRADETFKSIFACLSVSQRDPFRIARPILRSNFQPLILSSSRNWARPAAIANGLPDNVQPDKPTVWRKFVHDFRASAKRADRNPPPMIFPSAVRSGLIP